MRGRCSRLTVLLPRIQISLFQSRDLCNRNFWDGFSWTAGLVTYLGGQNITSPLCLDVQQCFPRELGDQSWLKIAWTSKYEIIGWTLKVISMSSRLGLYITPTTGKVLSLHPSSQ